MKTRILLAAVILMTGSVAVAAQCTPVPGPCPVPFDIADAFGLRAGASAVAEDQVDVSGKHNLRPGVSAVALGTRPLQPPGCRRPPRPTPFCQPWPWCNIDWGDDDGGAGIPDEPLASAASKQYTPSPLDPPCPPPYCPPLCGGGALGPLPWCGDGNLRGGGDGVNSWIRDSADIESIGEIMSSVFGDASGKSFSDYRSLPIPTQAVSPPAYGLNGGLRGGPRRSLVLEYWGWAAMG